MSRTLATRLIASSLALLLTAGVCYADYIIHGRRPTAAASGVSFGSCTNPTPCPTDSSGVNFATTQSTPATNYAYIEMYGDPQRSFFSTGVDWTFTAWIRGDVIAANDDPIVISQWNESGNRQMAIQVDDDWADDFDLEYRQNGGTVLNDQLNFISEDIWYFAACHYDTDAVGNDLTCYLYDTTCDGTTDTGKLGEYTTENETSDKSDHADLVLGIAGADTEGDSHNRRAPWEGDMAYVMYLEGTTFTQSQVEAMCANSCQEASNHDIGSGDSFFLPLDGTDYTDCFTVGNDGTARTGGSGASLGVSADGPYD